MLIKSYLNILVPSAGHDDGVLVVRREPDTRNPLSVTLLLDGVLALGQGVPQLDGLVPGARDNLAIIGRESDAQNIMAVILKAASGASSRQIPQSQVLVPRSGQGKVTVRGQDDVRDEVTMSMETLLGHTIVVLIMVQLPNDETFVAGSGQNDVRVLGVGGNLGDPATVALKGSVELERITHN